jgi:hypothetical protein
MSSEPRPSLLWRVTHWCSTGWRWYATLAAFAVGLVALILLFIEVAGSIQAHNAGSK